MILIIACLAPDRRKIILAAPVFRKVTFQFLDLFIERMARVLRPARIVLRVLGRPKPAHAEWDSAIAGFLQCTLIDAAPKDRLEVSHELIKLAVRELRVFARTHAAELLQRVPIFRVFDPRLRLRALQQDDLWSREHIGFTI